MSDEPKPAEPKPAGTFPSEADALLRELGMRDGQSTVDHDPSTLDPNRTAAHAPAGTPIPDSVSVPGYEILGELGRGGMGVVYKARQVALNRTVALKMILSGGHAGRSDILRFLAEAEAVAAVRHPNVVQVYDYGEHDGRPYMALEYLPGGSLAERLHKGGRPDPQEAAELVATLAGAVQAAHDQGIVHRDLKPANVLFEGDRRSGIGDRKESETGTFHSPARSPISDRQSPSPKVTDFGLAKRAASDLTATLAVMGTPAYMAPEQASGDTKFVGPAADVYSLGVILYECLTGVVPFRGDDAWSVVRKVATEEPEPPRKQVPSVPRDLELICLKCLAKLPHERYASAAALADDLGRFVRGESVSVKAAGPAERILKWARRKPTLAAVYALTVVALVLGAGVAGAVWLWQEAEGAKTELAGQKKETEGALTRETDARKREAAANEQLAGANTKLNEANGKLSNTNELLAAEKAKLAAANDFRAVDLAYRELVAENVLVARGKLAECREEFRKSWEYRFVNREATREGLVLKDRPPNKRIRWLVATPDSKRLATVAEGGERNIHVWDVAKSTDKPALTIPPATVPDNLQVSTYCLAISSDGKLLAGGCGGVVGVWDPVTGEMKHQFPTPPDKRGQGANRVFGVAFANGDKTLVAFAENGTVTAWEVATGKVVVTIPGPQQDGTTFSDLAVSADGKRVAVLWQTREPNPLRVYDAEKWEEVFTLSPPPLISMNGVRLDRTGARVAVKMSIRGVAVWDVAKKTEVCKYDVPRDRMDVLGGFTTNGTAVAISTFDDTILLIDARSGKVTQTLRGHTGRIGSITFAGMTLISGGEDGTVRVWPAESSRISPMAKGPWGQAVDISPDGRRVLFIDGGGGAALRELANGVMVGRMSPPNTGWMAAAAISPDGSRVAAVSSRNARLEVWNPVADTHVTGKELPIHTQSLWWSGDGKSLVIGGFNERSSNNGWLAAICDPVTAEPVGELALMRDRPLTVFATSDGWRYMNWKPNEGGLWLWDLRTQKPLLQFASATGREGGRAVVSPDTRLFAMVGYDRILRVWDTASGELRTKFDIGGPDPRAIAFTPDGKRLVIGHADGSVRFWDVATGMGTLSLRPQAADVTDLYFSRDGRWLAVIFAGKTSQLRDRTSQLFDAGPRPAK